MPGTPTTRRLLVLLALAASTAIVWSPAPAGAIDGTETITIFAGVGPQGSGGDGGPAVDASLYEPAHMAVDGAGNLYVAEKHGSRVRRIDPTTGIITTVAGTGSPNYGGDGGPATSALVGDAWGLAFDSAGNLYVSEPGFSRVRRIDAATGIITTVAGNGTFGYSGDGGPATDAELRSPYGLAVDSHDDLYIASRAGQRIRKVDTTTGIITTVAGNGVYNSLGDGGPATDASMEQPFGLDFDSADNLYIADEAAAVIRRVDATTGIITTVAGRGCCGYTGDGGPATDAYMNQPYDVAVGPDGNLYIALRSNYGVRRVDMTTGTITTVAGTGDYLPGSDGGAAASTAVGLVYGVALDTTGRLYISTSEGSNHRVWSVAPPASAPGAPTGVTATRRAGGAAVGWTAPASDGGSAITGYTVTASPGGATCTTTTTSCVVTGLANGTSYTFSVTADNAVGTGSPSGASDAVVPAAPPGPPGDVQVESGVEEATISWSPPSDDGGTPVTGYVVTASPGGPVCLTAETSCVVTGLSPDTTYSFTVVAVNDVDAGPSSEPSADVTVEATTTTTVTDPGGGGSGSDGGTSAAPATDDGTTTGAELAFTGSSARDAALLALVLAATGAALVLVERRRRYLGASIPTRTASSRPGNAQRAPRRNRRT